MNTNEIPPDFGNCPYCGSHDITAHSYYYSTLGTRQPSYHCKDCNRTFSYGTYFNKKTQEIRVDTKIADLQLYGMLKKVSDDQFKFTPLGRRLMIEHGLGKTDLSDKVALGMPVWKELSELLPLHPTREMFFRAVRELLKEDIPKQSVQEWMWNRYNVEIIPALERRNRKGLLGYTGITLVPNRVPL